MHHSWSATNLIRCYIIAVIETVQLNNVRLKNNRRRF